MRVNSYSNLISCRLSHLLDTRFSGVAIGVGQAKILGTLHYIPVQIGSRFLPCSISVVENLGPEFILGLDMLKRHQVTDFFSYYSRLALI